MSKKNRGKQPCFLPDGKHFTYIPGPASPKAAMTTYEVIKRAYTMLLSLEFPERRTAGGQELLNELLAKAVEYSPLELSTQQLREKCEEEAVKLQQARSAIRDTPLYKRLSAAHLAPVIHKGRVTHFTSYHGKDDQVGKIELAKLGVEEGWVDLCPGSLTACAIVVGSGQSAAWDDRSGQWVFLIPTEL